MLLCTQFVALRLLVLPTVHSQVIVGTTTTVGTRCRQPQNKTDQASGVQELASQHLLAQRMLLR